MIIQSWQEKSQQLKKWLKILQGKRGIAWPWKK